jgi:hypothetical protein
VGIAREDAVAEEFEWTIPATPISPADRAVQERITRELKRADIFVMGVDPPGQYVQHWRVTVHGGGKNELAQSILRRISGVRDVRPSAVSSSIIRFDVEPQD